MTSREKQVKKQAEQMVMQVIKYLGEATTSEKEYHERCLELATSFITTTVEFDNSCVDIIKYLNEVCLEVKNMAIGGALRYKAGDETNVTKIYHK